MAGKTHGIRHGLGGCGHDIGRKRPGHRLIVAPGERWQHRPLGLSRLPGRGAACRRFVDDVMAEPYHKKRFRNGGAQEQIYGGVFGPNGSGP